MVGWDSLTHILQSRYNYWSYWLLCIQCIIEKNDQSKAIFHKSLTKWYIHLLSNFPLRDPNQTSSERAKAHKKWSVPWTAPPSCRMTTVLLLPLLLVLLPPLLLLHLQKSKLVWWGVDYFYRLVTAKLSPLYRRQMDSLLCLVQFHVSSVICIRMEPHFLPPISESLTRWLCKSSGRKVVNTSGHRVNF